MNTTINLSDGTHTITVERPDWGTETIINMNMLFTLRADKHYSIWDNTATYDMYTSTWQFNLNAADQAEIEQLLTATAYGRGKTLTLPLGSTATGWYPFGPTKGDKGTFTVKLTEPPAFTGNQTGTPAHMFGVSLNVSAQSFPSYSFPTEIGSGTVALGDATGTPTVTALQFPSVQPSLDQVLNTGHSVTNGGTGYILDRGESADMYDAEFTFNLFEEKAQRLINYLVGTARGTEFSIIAPSGSYFFGNTKGSSGSYKVTLASPVIRVIHTNAKMVDVTFTAHYKETL